LGVGLTILPCKRIVEKPPRNLAIFNGRRFGRRPRPKLGCGAEEEEEEKKKKKNIWWIVQVLKLLIIQSSPVSRYFLPFAFTTDGSMYRCHV
jgi:hypothetical protein